MTPHPQVKEDMDRFMREFAINFEGKHQTAARRVIVIPALGVHGHGRPAIRGTGGEVVAMSIQRNIDRIQTTHIGSLPR